VVLTEPFWIRRFGGDTTVLGRAIRLNGEEYTVVGVLAPGFVLPIGDVEFVLPFAADRDPRRGARNSVNFIIGAGRLGDRATLPQATGELTAIAHRLQQQFPLENARKRGVRLIAAIDGIVGSFRIALLALFAAVGAVLIACANLANLMLTRATSRQKDLALRLALGASRVNVVRQVLVETSIVGLSGGVLGVLVARWGVAALVAMAPTALPRAGEIRVDGAVLMFSLVVSLFTSVLDRYLSDTVAPRRFSLSLMAAFSLAALALAITGIYAVVTYSVSQRAREIGIRLALGASRANIVRLGMGHGIRFVLIGLIAGVAMAAGATRLIVAMLFGVVATDVITIAQVVGFVAGVSVIACAVPTARAARLIVSVLKAE
jgi:ABC-type antimicrobial peptide transport system permease subunit